MLWKIGEKSANSLIAAFLSVRTWIQVTFRQGSRAPRTASRPADCTRAKKNPAEAGYNRGLCGAVRTVCPGVNQSGWQRLEVVICSRDLCFS